MNCPFCNKKISLKQPDPIITSDEDHVFKCLYYFCCDNVECRWAATFSFSYLSTARQSRIGKISNIGRIERKAPPAMKGPVLKILPVPGVICPVCNHRMTNSSKKQNTEGNIYVTRYTLTCQYHACRLSMAYMLEFHEEITPSRLGFLSDDGKIVKYEQVNNSALNEYHQSIHKHRQSLTEKSSSKFASAHQQTRRTPKLQYKKIR